MKYNTYTNVGIINPAPILYTWTYVLVFPHQKRDDHVWLNKYSAVDVVLCTVYLNVNVLAMCYLDHFTYNLCNRVSNSEQANDARVLVIQYLQYISYKYGGAAGRSAVLLSVVFSPTFEHSLIKCRAIWTLALDDCLYAELGHALSLVFKHRYDFILFSLSRSRVDLLVLCHIIPYPYVTFAYHYLLPINSINSRIKSVSTSRNWADY